jgi:hypothetical protein
MPIYYVRRPMEVFILKAIFVIIVPYGCETWYFILREGHKLKVFRTVFGAAVAQAV